MKIPSHNQSTQVTGLGRHTVMLRFAQILCSASVMAMCSCTALAIQTSLKKSVAVQRSLDGKDIHQYSVHLSRNQFARLTVIQRNIDLVINVYAPNGTTIGRFDSPNGMNGPEPVSFLTSSAGLYRIEIAPLQSYAGSGKYAITLNDIRSATAAELRARRVEREVLLAEDELSRAAMRRDIRRAGQLLAPEFISIRETGGRNVDRKGRIEEIKQFPQQAANHKESREISDLTTRIFGDTAVLAYRETQIVNGVREAAFHFTRVWHKRAGSWKCVVSRVMPASEPRPRKSISMTLEQLREFEGAYGDGPAPLKLRAEGDHLVITVGNGRPQLYPESDTDFIDPAEDHLFTFVRDSNGKIKYLIHTAFGFSVRLPRK